jgi:flagellar motility protein MotE (MotC chaperone)
MKSVLVLSAVTFLLIFGGVMVLILQLGAGKDSAPQLNREDYTAAERMLGDLQAERDRIQREQEQLALRRQSYAVQEQVLNEGQSRLQALLGELEARTQAVSAEQDASLQRLAKMYEVMPPQKAGPVLATLDLEITLNILRCMKERQAAAILAAMDPGVAAQISTRLSQGGAM